MVHRENKRVNFICSSLANLHDFSVICIIINAVLELAVQYELTMMNIWYGNFGLVVATTLDKGIVFRGKWISTVI